MIYKLSSPQRRKLLGESDIERRKTERELAGGGAEAEAKLIKQKLRSGELDNNNVRIAASLGNEAALMLFPNANKHNNIVAALYSIAPDFATDKLIYFAADCAEQALLLNHIIDNIKKNDFDLLIEALNTIRSYENVERKVIYDYAQKINRLGEGFVGDGGSLFDAIYAIESLLISIVISIVTKTRNESRAFENIYNSIDASYRAGVPRDWISSRFVDYLLDMV